MPYCPRSSLPAHVLVWLANRLQALLPPRQAGQPGRPPLSLEVRLDAVGAVILDGLSYRRAGRMVGICKSEVGDSLDLLLDPLVALGVCQPDGSFVTSLADLAHRLTEMAGSGEAAVLDGLATRVQRPAGWATRRSSTTPSATPTPPSAWRCPPSTATCCGATAAGPAAATSTSCSPCRGSTGCWTPPRSPPWSTAGFAGWPSPCALARADRGSAHHRSTHRRRTRLQPRSGRAARADGAVDRASGQCLVAAPLVLRQHQQRRAGWLEANAHLGPTYRQVLRELAWQRRAAGLAAEHHPRGYLREELGPIPGSTRGRRAWRQAAAAIQDYRRAYGISDPEQALGPAPRESAQRAAWHQAHTAAQRVQEGPHTANREERTAGARSAALDRSQRDHARDPQQPAARRRGPERAAG
jgi:hypothetical protein